MMQPGGGGMPGAPYGAPSGVTKIGNLTYNTAALLCYVPFMGVNFLSSIVFLVTEPRESRLVRFHAIQSLSLMAATILGVFCIGCCSGVMVPLMGSAGNDAAPVIGIVMLLLGLMQIGMLVVFLGLHVWLMVKAYGNEMWKIPLLGNIAASQTQG